MYFERNFLRNFMKFYFMMLRFRLFLISNFLCFALLHLILQKIIKKGFYKAISQSEEIYSENK